MFTRHIPAAAAAALMLLCGAAGAHDYKAGDLTIEHPYALATAPAARTGAGYLSVVNRGAEPDRLLAVRADFPMVQLHVTETSMDGVARMTEQQDGLEVPAGGKLTLAPQGPHVMFMGLTGPLVDGEKIAATLVFEKAGAVEVEFNVQPRGEGADAHEGHANE